MKKNGFTLIEILGVITLLALLAVVIIMVVDKNLVNSKNILSDVQIENIKSAASMWRTDHIDLIPDNGYYSISLSELQDNGYIRDEIIDPKTGQSISDDLIINVGINDVVVDDVLVVNDYRKLEYIESTGTQYIDINYVPKVGDVYSTSFQPLILNKNQVFFGSRSTGDWTTSNDQVYLNQSNSGDLKNKLLFFSGIDKTVYSVLSLGQTNNYTFETSSGQYNGSSSNSLYLFALNNAGTVVANSNIRFYVLKIYNGNTLVRNYVPCMRKSDNAVGVCDLVNNVFYGNSGTGDFIYKLPKESPYERLYTKVDYVKSNGNQYIDLGYKAKINTEVRLDMELIENDNTNSASVTATSSIIGRNLTTDSNTFSFNFGGNADQSKIIYYWTDKTYASGAPVKLKEYSSVTPRSTIIVKSGSATFQGETIETSMKKENNTENMILLGSYNSSESIIQAFNRYDVKVYGFQIYEGNTLIKNLVPCKRNRDNKVGLYDEVNDVFYVSNGSSDFLLPSS